MHIGLYIVSGPYHDRQEINIIYFCLKSSIFLEGNVLLTSEERRFRQVR